MMAENENHRRFLAVSLRVGDTRAGPEALALVASIRDRTRLLARANADRAVAVEVCAALAWKLDRVTFLSPDGEVVACNHHVCLLRGGTIVDPTADRFGLPSATMVAEPSSDIYRRYRSPFDEDWNPDVATGASEVREATGSVWRGVPDERAEALVRAERGHDWWMDAEDDERLLTYLRRMEGLREDRRGELRDHWTARHAWPCADEGDRMAEAEVRAGTRISP